MSTFKQRTVDFLEIEWATYIERYNRWPAEYGVERVNAQGFSQFRDMLAHVLGWWDEAMPIILAIAEEREYARRKYDFDVFNAESIAKYKDWDEAEFLAQFEKMRQNALADIKAMNEAAFENRRVRAWINGIFISHAREHLVALSRFLTLDTLENEWSTYIQKFDELENKDEFLQKQGFEKFEDVLAHTIGWWDEGTRIVKGVLADPAFVYEDPDTDPFNAALIEKYKNTSSADIRTLFENKRIELVNFVREMPESAFENKIIESWLAADVVEHFDGHAIG